MIFIRCPVLKSLKCVDTGGEGTNVRELISGISHETGIHESLLLPHDGCKQLLPESVVPCGTTVYLTLTLPGGKGGFGSMLRAIGAQIEKTTNREACRDLSGRRLRDINEEQRLKKWLAKKVEREAEAERRHKERLLRLKEQPKHDFNDPEYNKVRSELPERIDDALSEGLKKEKKKPVKKHLEAAAGPSSKKPCLWLDVDVSSGSEDDESEYPSDACKGSSSCQSSHSKESTKLSDESSSSNCASVSCDTDSAEDPQHNSNSSDQVYSETGNNKVASKTNPFPKIEEMDAKAQEGTATDKDFGLEDIMVFNNIHQLEELGLEKLKNILKNLGLKCGGTLSERAQRVWSVRGLDPKDYPTSLRAKVSHKNA